MNTPVATLTTRGTLKLRCEPADSYYIKQIDGRMWVGSPVHHDWELPATPYVAERLKALLPSVVIHPQADEYIRAHADWHRMIAEAKEGDGAWQGGLLSATPYAHQRKAVAVARAVLEGSRSFGLWHDMGLGKTVTGLQIIGELLAEKGGNVLVVCPLSVIDVWAREAEKFVEYDMRVIPLAGTVAKRASQVVASTLVPYEGVTMYITNYEVIWKPVLLNAFNDARIDIMLADEAHRLKNPQSKQSMAARKITPNNVIRIAATGTPVDTLTDWYGIYRWLNPAVFGSSFSAFKARYFHEVAIPGGISIVTGPKQEMLDELLTKAHSLGHACAKEDALDLPKKIDIERYCELEPKARKMYETMRDEAIAFLEDSSAVLGQNTLTRLLRMTQITGGFLRDEEGAVVQVSEAKMRLLKDTLLDVLSQEKKVVIIAHKTPEIEAIEGVLRRYPWFLKKGSGVGVIAGGVPEKKRQEYINEFQNGDMRVMIVQERAGGAGITLHASSMEIVYSTGGSSIDYRQARDRVHRIGQKDECRYIHLLCENTIDKKILDSLREKTDIAKMSPAQARALLA